MSELDEKLKKIVFGDTPDHFMSDHMLAKPEQIKQLFKDAGYIRGQELYEGFEKEISKLENSYHKWVGPLPSEVLEAAKRASGLV